MTLPQIPRLEVLVAELIALILLILAGARLILHDWRLLRSSDGDHLRSPALPQRASRGSHHIAGKRIRKLNFGQRDKDPVLPILRRVLRESRVVAKRYREAEKR